MAFILPKAATLTENIATGLGSGLEALAQQKLQQIQQRNLAQQLSQLVPQQKASAISGLPENLQNIALKEQLAAPGRQAYAQALGNIQGNETQSIPQNIGLNERQATDLAKLGQKERQIGTVEAKEARKYLEPYEATHIKGKELLQQNRELKEIVKSGDLRSGTTQAVLDTLGLGSYFQPLSNQLAQKNLAAQSQNAAAAFNTSRLTNLDIGLFQKSLGTLWNTPQGLYAIASINNLKQKAKDAVHKERRKIISENKGKVPFDIEEQSEQRAQPLLSKYAKKSMEVITNAASKYLKATAKRPTSFDSLNEIKKSAYEPGTRIIDDETGAEYIWDGNKLIKE